MKGLLYKDFRRLIVSCRVLFVVVLIFVLMPPFVGNDLLALYACLLSGMLPMTLLSYDEYDKFDRYVKLLPVGGTKYVAAKYLAGLFVSLAVMLLTLVSEGTGMAFRGDFSLVSLASDAMRALTVSLLAPTLLLPLIFRFGVSKGRIAYFLFVGLIAGFFGTVSAGGGDAPPVDTVPPMILLAVTVGVAGLYAASMGLSMKLYEKRKI